jgi:hypothetical protein
MYSYKVDGKILERAQRCHSKIKGPLYFSPAGCGRTITRRKKGTHKLNRMKRNKITEKQDTRLFFSTKKMEVKPRPDMIKRIK